MTLEEVGTKLVVEAAQQFYDQMTKAGAAVSNFGNETVKTSKKTEKANQGTLNWGKSLRKLAEYTIGVFTAHTIADFAKDSVRAASDMNETLTKSGVVFGDFAGIVEDMGNRSALAMGISKQEAIAAAATYGNLFTSMGMGRKVSADMSVGLVQLASDLASFNNIPVADALEKIRAGLVGEAEPLRTLGININEAALRQKALELGLRVGTGVLDSATKAQAAYALMLEQSTNAQGDFARTADGAANQQRILEATVKDLKVEIGNGLLPIWVSLLKTMNEGIATFNLLRTKQEKLDDVVRQHEKEIRGTTSSYEAYITEMRRAISVANGFKNWTQYTQYMKQHNLSLQEVYTSYGVLDRLGWDYIHMQQAENKTVAEAVPLTEDQARAMDELNKQMGDLASGVPWKTLIRNGQDFAAAEAEIAKQAGAADLAMAGVTNKFLLAQSGLEKGTPAWWDLALALGVVTDKEKLNADNFYLLKDAYDKGLITQDQYIQGLKTLNSTLKETPSTVAVDVEIMEKWSSDWLKNNLYTWGLGNQTFTVTTNYSSSGPGINGGPGGNPNPTPTTPTPPSKPKTKGGRQHGGAVTAGWPYWVGESGPEPFVPSMSGYVLSKADAERIFASQVAIAAPSSIFGGLSSYNYSTANNFNLSVMTSQTPAVVQRSFALLKMLA